MGPKSGCVFKLEQQRRAAGADIDPVFYDSPYYLVPDELARKSYVLLSRAMEESNRVAIATFVMRTKQYLVAIRSVDGALMMSTMVYADEVVSPADIPGLEVVAAGTAWVGGDTPQQWTATIYPGPKGNFVFNAATIFWATASISWSVSVFSVGWIVTERAIDFLPSGMPGPA